MAWAIMRFCWRNKCAPRANKKIPSQFMQEPHKKTHYEALQEYNLLTGWLHSRRYQHIFGIIGQFAASKPDQSPIRILEIGCGPAKLYSVLTEFFPITYLGCEIHPAFVEAARSRHGDQPNFEITDQSITSGNVSLENWDIIVALETLEHIPEHDVVRLIEKIAKAHSGLFVCSVPVEIGPTVWLKNVGAWLCRYPRYQEYKWKETFWAGCYQLDKIPLHQTGHIGFDWRWLAQTIRHNMRITSLRHLPCRWLPAAVSSSVFIVAESRSRISMSS